MTKREAKARKLAWATALNEGRVVRVNGGEYFRSFPTVEGATAFLAECEANGVVANRCPASQVTA